MEWILDWKTKAFSLWITGLWKVNTNSSMEEVNIGATVKY